MEENLVTDVLEVVTNDNVTNAVFAVDEVALTPVQISELGNIGKMNYNAGFKAGIGIGITGLVIAGIGYAGYKYLKKKKAAKVTVDSDGYVEVDGFKEINE